ncbi:hypothetical protein PAXRUDRAFT_167699 [Paxillus rubicundulus Ve08.2h10]|uniref:Uncharacterized protein n=1 Tax=Paxillus rubicundulus Ve08.2h10 TaxID=930991 RepID=A0A0D0DGR9_9AGAM|nr:hypothetical protein PAXRUDRAFT_167699 [Paxillus rubicundulus Ve08.2h10]
MWFVTSSSVSPYLTTDPIFGWSGISLSLCKAKKRAPTPSPLPFMDHAEEMTGIFYAPELLAPQPIFWLPNDSVGVMR